jgi:uncharacterized protein DUF6703
MRQRLGTGQRLAIVAGAIVVGAVFIAGLFVHGRVGGALLLVTVAILIGLTRLTWPLVRPQGRPLRLIVIAAVAILAVVKLING